MLKKFTKEERSWILYDVANSAYTLTFVTVFFPIFFGLTTKEASIDETQSTAYLQYAISAYAVVVAILAPILGNLADYKDHKKKFFKFFLFMGLIFGVLLCIPNISWKILLIIYIIATIGYAGANVFYDAFLVDVTKEDNYDVVSSNGFAWGYIGSVIPFILGLAIYGAVLFDIIALDEKVAIYIAFLLALLWWGIFSMPILKNVNQKYYIEKRRNWISESFKRLVKTFKKISKDRKILFFLIGYFFYIDAVYTIIKSAVNIGQGLNITSSVDLAIIVLIVQFIAFPCAIIFGQLSKKIGEIKMLSIGIMIYFVICALGYFITQTWHLFLFAGLVGLAQGGIQAVSRAYFGKLIPKEHSGEYFGFFNIFGKFAAILGPLLIGISIEITGDVHYGTPSLIPLLAIGLVFLLLSSKYGSKSKECK